MSGVEILKSAEKFKITLGLERIKKALELFGNPQDKIRFIHVAGTNGKGSTCAIIERILLEDGRKRIGKYTSPHLFSYSERFSVDGKNIEEKELEELISIVNIKDKEENLDLSEFEILTVVCFLFFARHNVEIGILEVGLGGRLDATNVIKEPLISIITSISFDHKERLGETIEKIAFEKAGIFKKDSKALFLRENEGYETLLKCAKKAGAILVDDNLRVEVEDNVALIDGEKFEFSLNGDFQKENLKLALLAIKNLPFTVEKETIKKALKKVKWKFRIDKVLFNGHNLLLDGCHNPGGAKVLVDYLKKYHKGKKIKFIFGCLAHKDYKEILNILCTGNEDFDFCFYEFNYNNVLKFENLGKFKNNFRQIEDPLDEINKGGYDLCAVSGSLYMLGEIFKGVL